MRANTIWSILGAIVAVIVAWWLVEAVFHIVWFLVKFVIVLLVAAGVFFALRSLFTRTDR